MSEQYNKEYYDQYDVGVGKVNYEGSVYTKGFLEKIADHIVADLHPKTVLDAGCAMGYLVAALRDRGVEAYGIDISDYAISKVREDIRSYCVVGSLTDPLPDSFPRRFDLVTNIEVLEHLYAQEGETALKNLCALTDCIIFSSTPDDFTEPTHVNVQQREYWARLFAQAGFYDDLNYRPAYLSPQALCFRRKGDWLRQVEDYERSLRMLERQRVSEGKEWAKAVEDKERHIQNQNGLLAAADQRQVELEQIVEERNAQLEREKAALDQERIEHQAALDRMELEHRETLDRAEADRETLRYALAELETAEKEAEGELAHYQEYYDAALAQCEDLKRQLAQIQQSYSAISNAFFWKITKPFRLILDGVKSLLKRNYYTHLFCKGLKCWKENGIVYTWRKAQAKRRGQQDLAKTMKGIYTLEELERQRKNVFPRNVKISILVPLYNTPAQYLQEMIQSVLDQTYRNWELCLADGSDEAHQDVETICCQYMGKDSRIKYRKLEKNEGISGNTNACIEMSTGDYIALFDHDDLLHPAALHEIMRAICEQDADFIYTDESTFRNKPEDAYCPNFKPDYAPDTLRSYNYICHLSVFSRQLLKKAGGGFRSEFDGSQDYDMILRLTEKAEHIVHIPIILYYWRAHDGSVAADVSAKPYTILAAKNAIAAHMKRLGLKGEVLDSAALTTYRVRYEIEGTPLISILIPNKDHVEDLKKCITSIVTKTTYPAWEIVVVENGSDLEETFAYYEQLQEDKRIRVVQWKGDFNYSAINNFGFRYAKGEFVLLLNNDTEVITPDWLQEMLMFCQRRDVGAVGCMLYYPDDTIQHAGVILGLGGVAGHSHKYAKRGDYGYMCRLALAQDLAAVTAACMMVRRSVWEEINGLDVGFRVAFNDVDLCMRIRKAGYLIVWTPYAELYHYESKSRGYEDTPEKQARFAREVRRFQERWGKELAEGDPYYNSNLTLNGEDFSVR